MDPNELVRSSVFLSWRTFLCTAEPSSASPCSAVSLCRIDHNARIEPQFLHYQEQCQRDGPAHEVAQCTFSKQDMSNSSVNSDLSDEKTKALTSATLAHWCARPGTTLFPIKPAPHPGLT